MNIFVKVIPHSEQRYDTCGDWYYDSDRNLVVCVSACGSKESETLVAIHEIVEAMLCEADGIPLAIVDSFDMSYEGDDPGNDPLAPYHSQHVLAEIVERLVALNMHVNWEKHDQCTDTLFKESS